MVGFETFMVFIYNINHFCQKTNKKSLKIKVSHYIGIVGVSVRKFSYELGTSLQLL